MQRTIYAYDLSFKSYRGKKIIRPKDFVEDLAVCMKSVNMHRKVHKTENFKSDKKIMYINKISYNKTERIIRIIFISARYGVVRNVMDTQTFVNKGQLKRKPDGDLEKTHIIIKFMEDGHALCLYEHNRDGISLGKIISYLNKYVKEYHTSREDMCYYTMECKNMVSRDFLKSLEMLKRIKAVTLTVDQEDIEVSDTKAFAERNDISNEVDIVLKPTGRGKTIMGNTVKDFYNIYNNKSMPIKRITVDGDRESKEPLVFDTEKMKEKYPVEVLEETNGEVMTADIFREMHRLCQYY